MPRLAVSRPRFRVSLRGLALLLAVAGGTAVHSQEADAPAIPAEPAPAVSDRTPWRYIVIHHSATPSGNARSFDRMHRGKGWDGVAYHFVIDNGKGGPDGRLEVTHRWWDQKHGAHAGGLPAGADPEAHNEYNEFGVGICLVGNFQNRPPTRKQMETLVRLIERLRDQYGISEQAVFGHRHVRGTACPGAKFPWKSLYARLRLASPAHLARRDAVPTYDLCHWCQQQPEVASAGGRLVRRQAPAAGAELPPPIMLTR